MRSPLFCVRFLVFCALLSLVSSFYLPGVAPTDYKKGEPLSPKVCLYLLLRQQPDSYLPVQLLLVRQQLLQFNMLVRFSLAGGSNCSSSNFIPEKRGTPSPTPPSLLEWCNEATREWSRLRSSLLVWYPDLGKYRQLFAYRCRLSAWWQQPSIPNWSVIARNF